MLAALKRKKTRALGGGYGTSLIDNAPSSSSSSSSASGSSSGSNSVSGSAGDNNNNHSHSHSHGHGAAMEAMSGALDLGDTQLVLAGLFHNLPLVRGCGGPSDPHMARLGDDYSHYSTLY